MDLSTLHPAPGSNRKRKRVGRGPGSGHGKTAGRGHKGYGSRAGSGTGRGREGGQMPLQRRLPKRGFRNIFRQEYSTVNLKDLAKFPPGSVVDAAVLREQGVVKRRHPLKVLGDGDIGHALTVRAHAFSSRARERIVAAGGTAEDLRNA